ncbi:MAG: aspartate-semialdehyde dehydrogenase [Anaerolineae bacterium]
MKKIKVAVLGATGAVGQRFVQLLDRHPWFEVSALTGSDRSVGKTYREACRWVLPEPMPETVREQRILPTQPGLDAPLVFSALPSDSALDAEPAFARAGHAVCSNASSHRMADDVPLLIPEVNPDHTALIALQRQRRGWSGFIATNPNCTSTGLTIAFRPLQDAFGLQRALAFSMQALSGAGYPGVASLDIVDNVIPYIKGEEDKVEEEPRKMLGQFAPDSGRLTPAPLRLSAHTNRVTVVEGHTVCVSLEFDRPVAPGEAAQAMRAFQAPAIVQSLPSAPQCVIDVRPEPDRPQPRKDRDAGRGMTTVVGRVREDPLLHVKFVVLSHNTIRGAAGGSLLNAELLVAQGIVG